MITQQKYAKMLKSGKTCLYFISNEEYEDIVEKICHLIYSVLLQCFKKNTNLKITVTPHS